MSEQARYSEHIYQEYACGMHVEPIHQQEGIVRCRDCKHAAAKGSVCYYFMTIDTWENPVPSEVEPDGFCKWGKPKENE